MTPVLVEEPLVPHLGITRGEAKLSLRCDMTQAFTPIPKVLILIMARNEVTDHSD
jgi:hypothetical protein